MLFEVNNAVITTDKLMLAVFLSSKSKALPLSWGRA
jgi:hypothetical protein